MDKFKSIVNNWWSGLSKKSKGWIIGVVICLILACIGYIVNPNSLKKNFTNTDSTSSKSISQSRTSSDKKTEPTVIKKFKKGDVVKFLVPYDGSQYYGVIYSSLPKYIDYKEYLSDIGCTVENDNSRFRILDEGVSFSRSANALSDSYKPVWYMVEDIDGNCGIGYVFEAALISAY
jgi:hypothetical protein